MMASALTEPCHRALQQPREGQNVQSFSLHARKPQLGKKSHQEIHSRYEYTGLNDRRFSFHVIARMTERSTAGHFSTKFSEK